MFTKQTKTKYNLKLNLRSLLIYERLSHKPFSSFERDLNESEMYGLYLLYGMIVANNDLKITFEEAVKTLFVKADIMLQLKEELDRLVRFSTQFNYIREREEEDIDATEKPKEDTEVWLEETIPYLIAECGLTPQFVLDEMQYADIQMYVRSARNRYHEKMEEQRLFAYYQIIYQLQTNKHYSPQDIIPLPWEEKKKKRKQRNELKEMSTNNKLADILRKEKERLEKA